MFAATHSSSGWPMWLVEGVRAIRSVFHYVSHQSVLGLPLDWIVRFALLAAAHLWLSRRMSRMKSAGLCIVALVAKELFDCLAVLDPSHPRPPGLDDAADIVSGLLGLVLGDVIMRLSSWRGRTTGQSRIRIAAGREISRKSGEDR